MNNTNLNQKAEQLGIDAHKSGKKSTPVLDSNLMNLIKENRQSLGNQIGASTSIFKSWLKGWHKSNSTN